MPAVHALSAINHHQSQSQQGLQVYADGHPGI